jgi:hypothetical protein
LVWDLKDDVQEMAFLIHDNDKKFPTSFDIVFSSEGVEIVHTPYQACGGCMSHPWHFLR